MSDDNDISIILLVLVFVFILLTNHYISIIETLAIAIQMLYDKAPE